jgi:hypothetical protein
MLAVRGCRLICQYGNETNVCTANEQAINALNDVKVAIG